METEPSSTTRQAAHRACHTCSAAKVRCIQVDLNPHSKCERCTRLNKECKLQPLAVKRARKKRTTRVAQLEQKLDGLVSLLTSKETTSYLSPDSTGRDNPCASPGVVHAAPSPNSGIPSLINPRGSCTFQGHADPTDALSDVQADAYLDRFRSRIIPNFPFVPIGADCTARKLRVEKPALFRSIIMAASYHDTHQLLLIGEYLLGFFIDMILVRVEKSLDVLQGLMVYIAFSHSLVHLKGRATSLLQLGAALVTDLGISNAPSASERYPSDWGQATNGTRSYGANMVTTRTLEGMRAYAGMFYLTSSVTSRHHEFHSLRPTAYLEECCTALSKTGELLDDAFLVKIVRLQIVTERVAQTLVAESTLGNLGYSVPLRTYVQPFKLELDSLKQSFTDDIAQHDMLMLHFHNAEIHLYEVGLSSASNSARRADSAMYRNEILWNCLFAIRAYHEILDKFCEERYFDVPSLLWMQVTYSVISMYKLSLLESEHWDVAEARRVFDISKLLDKLSKRYAAARRIGGLCEPMTDADADIFSRFSRRLRSIKENYDEKLVVPSTSGTPIGDQGALMVDDVEPIVLPPWDDEGFWNGILCDNWQ